MSKGFAKPITIKEAIDNIVSRKYLLPAIQRKFVWSSGKIEVLFDSIMRGYPINSFMFWEVREDKIKNSFKFYQFLTEYRERFKEDNIDIDTKGNDDFFAVIDGQQRLTGIYLGLKGSYAYRLPRKWLRDDEESMPTRHLYLNLAVPMKEDNERQMAYDFRFLTDTEVNHKSFDQSNIWFKVNDILKYDTPEKVDNHIDCEGWLNKDFTKQTFRRLRKVIFEELLVNYYLETNQEIDIVLDIFIRTNSGGVPLSFSDLLMSITTANWKMDARKAIDDVVNKSFQIGSPGFVISRDLVLKTCLVLFNDNIKFQVRNFDSNSVKVFEENWMRIQKSILETFKLIESFGFNNVTLRAKNAIIPIVYYIYHRGIENEINNPLKFNNDKTQIKKWLCLSLIKGVFGGQSDNILRGIRKVIKTELEENPNNPIFPLLRIKDEFKLSNTKNLTLSADAIAGMLEEQKGTAECFAILSLLYSHLNFMNQTYHQDHLHPASYFTKLDRSKFVTDEDFNFYTNDKNWNGVANLQLLNGILNNSKNDMSLIEWVEENKIDRTSQLIPECGLDIKDFKDFIEKRKELLANRLLDMI